MDRKTYFGHLSQIFLAGIEAVEPSRAVHRCMKRDGRRLSVCGREYSLDDYDYIYLIGVGKAGAPMARAMEEILADDLVQGVVVVKYGYGCGLKKVEIVEAGHPVPDHSGLMGTQRIQDLLKRATAKDLIFCLLSGGGSALLPSPVEGITLEEKQEVTQLLLACGASIGEINAIRKHLSTMKGGQLARLVYPAPLISLILSDVIGDPLDVIASGPTAPDLSTFEDCVRILEKYGLTKKVPASVTGYLQKGIRGEIQETPKAGDPAFGQVKNCIIANNLYALKAAQRKAEELGYQTLILSSQIEGETREVALVHSGIFREVITSGEPVPPPACILSGGETTVTLRGRGVGGRNQEFALALAICIQAQRRIFFLSAGTDGTDGPTDVAGAFVDGETVERAINMGINARDYLEDNNSYSFFARLDDLFRTGPTNTNVMDLRIAIIV